jgi:hypothetical protein
LLHFVELDEFRDDWVGLGLDSEHDLFELQLSIMGDPVAAPLVEGTGGLRKMRFAPRRWRRGKSGSVRVCYAYFENHWLVLLVMAYAKNEQETLTAHEKTAIKAYFARVQRWLDERSR